MFCCKETLSTRESVFYFERPFLLINEWRVTLNAVNWRSFSVTLSLDHDCIFKLAYFPLSLTHRCHGVLNGWTKCCLLLHLRPGGYTGCFEVISLIADTERGGDRWLLTRGSALLMIPPTVVLVELMLERCAEHWARVQQVRKNGKFVYLKKKKRLEFHFNK